MYVWGFVLRGWLWLFAIRAESHQTHRARNHDAGRRYARGANQMPEAPAALDRMPVMPPQLGGEIISCFHGCSYSCLFIIRTDKNEQITAGRSEDHHCLMTHCTEN